MPKRKYSRKYSRKSFKRRRTTLKGRGSYKKRTSSKKVSAKKSTKAKPKAKKAKTPKSFALRAADYVEDSADGLRRLANVGKWAYGVAKDYAPYVAPFLPGPLGIA